MWGRPPGQEALAGIEGSLGGKQAMPSGNATAQQTAGHKLIAAIVGGRLPAFTGVSTSAVPFLPHAKGDGADLADGPEVCLRYCLLVHVLCTVLYIGAEHHYPMRTWQSHAHSH